MWETNNGTPYCVLLPLYTHTKANDLCCDKDMFGHWSFIPAEQINKKKKDGRKPKKFRE